MENYERGNIEMSVSEKDYVWRVSAKFITFVDLTILLVALVAVFIGVPFLLFNETSEQYNSICISGVVAVIVFALSIWLTSLLVVATHKETNSKIAQKKAKIWMGINIVLLLSSVLGIIAGGDLILLLILVVPRAFLLLFVGVFIGELNKVVAAEEQCPTAVESEVVSSL